jgi:hypothetical protein
MVSRRRKAIAARRKALGDFISRDVDPLKDLAQYLNGDRWIHARADGTPANPGESSDRDQALAAAAEAVIDVLLDAPYPEVPKDAATRFSALARGAELRYVADPDGAVHPGDGFRLSFSDREHLQWVLLETPTSRGVWSHWLAHLLDNPQRERLRRCQQCRRWFVDETRNRSARRCSRACTIAWSNSLRTRSADPKKGPRR